ncbi:hypothetical protein BU16DRAFT_565082 [Lophium mytilinum]|uniref:Uncharacterized protein n=1 Tax=Lophium mytilinum TaxID=390894 RepID=A0A6A6QG42_9PEZI|nr:hypothetical protein BU16DRAFT_565082 [Lophium mytilinum]
MARAFSAFSKLNPLQPDAALSVAPRSETEPRASKTHTYFAVARDPTNVTETTEIKTFLDAIVVGKDKFVNEVKLDTVRDWGHLTLDEAGLKAVKNYEGINGVQKETALTRNGALPTAKEAA